MLSLILQPCQIRWSRIRPFCNLSKTFVCHRRWINWI